MFETLIFTDLKYARIACNTPKTKETMKLHHMTPLKIKYAWMNHSYYDQLDSFRNLFFFFFFYIPVLIVHNS